MLSMISPNMLGAMQMAAPRIMTTGPASLQGKVIYMNGQPFMLQECSGSDVYCNALIDEPYLSEGADGPAPWKPTVTVDPMSVDPWLHNVGGGIY